MNMEAQTMLLNRKSHLNLAVVLVAATMVIAGGMTIASNTGFKINKGLRLVQTTDTGQKGSNWVSIPYFNPYNNGTDFCTQTGLRSALAGATTTIAKQDPVTGSTSSANCFSAGSFTLVPGQGLKIRPAAIVGGVANPNSIIIVGSHNPSLSLTIPKPGAGQVGNFWFSVPYHTTAVTAADLCSSIGMTSTGIVGKATIGRLDPNSGSTTTGTCGTSSATTLVLNLGEAVVLREPTAAPLTFVPSHF
jgi:hypothetical protein